MDFVSFHYLPPPAAKPKSNEEEGGGPNCSVDSNLHHFFNPYFIATLGKYTIIRDKLGCSVFFLNCRSYAFLDT
jgi:hypothetical protein